MDKKTWFKIPKILLYDDYCKDCYINLYMLNSKKLYLCPTCYYERFKAEINSKTYSCISS